ncbi:hypothetical protein CLOM_g10802 [Closterium sp. NIES-68]|nr:hypothetical protein CLOM_g10802 [Closterium sp. NIES-68]
MPVPHYHEQKQSGGTPTTLPTTFNHLLNSKQPDFQHEAYEGCLEVGYKSLHVSLDIVVKLVRRINDWRD